MQLQRPVPSRSFTVFPVCPPDENEASHQRGWVVTYPGSKVCQAALFKDVSEELAHLKQVAEGGNELLDVFIRVVCLDRNS